MRSDSRTATASSSKSRPKWRDKYLSQLTDEQLDEVKAYRNDASLKADVKANDEQFDQTQPLQKQAGPERSAHVNDLKDPGSSGADRPRSRADHNGEKQQSPDRRDEQHSRTRPSSAGLESSRHNRKEHKRSGQHRADKPPRYRSDEGNYEHRAAKNAVHHRTDKSSKEQHRSGVQESPEIKKRESLFARLFSFKVSRSVKFGLMALAIVCMVAVSFLKPIDHSSQSDLESAMWRAGLGFGLAKTLNGVISVAQGTEFAVQPAGVGVNFSPGEILDPVNDLVETFSAIMFFATVSLGVQQVLLEVSSWIGISFMLGGAGLFFLLTRMRNGAMSSLADIAGRLLLLMLLVRFLIPLGSIANDWVYHKFLEPSYEESSEQLKVASDRIREISTRETETKESSGSLTDRAKSLYSSVTSKFDFDGMLDDYKESAENVSENAINLVVVFMLQTVLFPLLFLFIVYRIFRSVLLPSRVRAP